MGGTYGSPTGSATVTSSTSNATFLGFELTSITDEENKKIRFDPDLVNLGAGNYILEVGVPSAQFGDLDLDNLSSIECDGTDINAMVTTTHTDDNTKQLRRLTQLSGSNIHFYWSTSVDVTSVALGTGGSANGVFEFAIKDDFTNGGATGAVVGQNPRS